MRGVALVGLTLVALATGSVGRGAATPVTLTQQGISRGGEVFGTFSAASDKLCSSGTFLDALGQRSGNQIRVERTHTCADGSGTFVLLYSGVTENLAGVGTWSVVSGTGRYDGLGGRGTTSNVVTSYDAATGEGTFTNTWRGVLDFDTAAPTATIGKPSVRFAGPGRVRLRVPLRLRDAAGNRVAYVAEVYVPGRGILGRRAGGRTAGSTVTLAFVLRPGLARRVVLEVALTDPVGNERVVRRTIRVRR